MSVRLVCCCCAFWTVCAVFDNKSELMLMGRATASVWFRTQVVLVYLQCISAKIHSKCSAQPKIAKNSLKTHILGVQGRSGSSMLVPPESSSAVLVMIRSKSVSVCNHSRARLVDSSRNRTFSRRYQNLMRSCGGLEPGGKTLHRWNLRLMPNISYVVLVHLERFWRNALLKCVLQPKIPKNSLKTHILGVQGHSGSSLLVPLESSSAVLVIIRSKPVSISIYNHSRARLVDSSRHRTFWRGTQIWCARTEASLNL